MLLRDTKTGKVVITKDFTEKYEEQFTAQGYDLNKTFDNEAEFFFKMMEVWTYHFPEDAEELARILGFLE